MTIRLSNAVVNFERPFILDGFGTVQPAGSYTIEIEEEKLDAVLPESWRRLGTSIQLIRDGRTEYVSVDPYALTAALERDNAQADNLRLEKRAKSRTRIARKLNRFSSRPTK